MNQPWPGATDNAIELLLAIDGLLGHATCDSAYKNLCIYIIMMRNLKVGNVPIVR